MRQEHMCNCYQVDADLVDVGVFKVGVAKFFTCHVLNNQLQPHCTKIPRSTPGTQIGTTSLQWTRNLPQFNCFTVVVLA